MMNLQEKDDKILNIEHLSVEAYDSRQKKCISILKDVNFSVCSGEILAIVGASGGGKSMLCKSIMRLLPANIHIRHGHIWLGDQDIAYCSEKEMRYVRGKEIAMILQHPKAALNPTMTIESQIAEAVRVFTPEINRKQLHARVLELLEMVRIPDARKCCKMYPYQFSGGMCQRVLIAMVLAGQPKLLLADEPTSALDVRVQTQILELLKDIQKRTHMSMIFVSHDLDIVRDIADRVAVLYQSEIVEIQKAEALYKMPAHIHTKKLLENDRRLHAQKNLNENDGLKIKSDSENEIKKNEVLLEVTDLTHIYKVRHQYLKAVRNVSFQIKKGEIFGIIGASGSGKSTIAKCLMRIERPEKGTVDFENIHLCDAKDVRAHRAYIEQNIQMIFQDSATSLNPRMKVRDIIAEPMKVQHIKPEEGWASMYDKLLNTVGLEKSFLDRYPGELSGGQRQRVAIARALSVNPKLLVADEAVSSLDILTQRQIMDVFINLRKQYDCSILFISHNLTAIRYMCDRVGIMQTGKMVRIVPAWEVTEDDI